MNRLRLAHALTTPAGKGVAVPGLIDAFVHVTAGDVLQVRWAIGGATEATFDDAYADAVIALAFDSQYERDREMLALALGKSKKAESVDALLALAEDADVDGTD